MSDSSVASGTYTISSGGGSPPSFVQLSDNNVSSGSSVGATFTSATTAGNTIVAYVIWDNSGTAAVTDSGAIPSSAWARSGMGWRVQGSDLLSHQHCGGTDTVTSTFQAAVTSFGVIYAHEYSGINTSNPVDVTASASGTSGNLTSGSATSSVSIVKEIDNSRKSLPAAIRSRM
jgi:hypothetical protein